MGPYMHVSYMLPYMVLSSSDCAFAAASCRSLLGSGTISFYWPKVLQNPGLTEMAFKGILYTALPDNVTIQWKNFTAFPSMTPGAMELSNRKLRTLYAISSSQCLSLIVDLHPGMEAFDNVAQGKNSDSFRVSRYTKSETLQPPNGRRFGELHHFGRRL